MSLADRILADTGQSRRMAGHQANRVPFAPLRDALDMERAQWRLLNGACQAVRATPGAMRWAHRTAWPVTVWHCRESLKP